MSMSSSGFGYGAAIDAGSSGSRIYLYRWPKNQDTRQLTRVESEAIFSEERNPGISDEQGVGVDMLHELVALAESYLPPGVDPGEVSIYLGATAGLRLVDESSERDIMSRVRSVLHDSRFQFHDVWARTISGEEEGLYDWLVANYLKNGGDFPTTSTTTYGALDLGGASTQISFPSLEDNTFPLRIGSMEFPLKTKSFLHFGVDQARVNYDDKFASNTKINPCYPIGYTDSTTDISGSSDWESCLSSVAQLFDSNEEGAQTNPIPSQHIVDEQQKFIAMSAFVYTWDFLGLNIGDKTQDLDALLRRSEDICNRGLKQQEKQFERRSFRKPTNRILMKPHTQCFNAAFSYQLLSKGYGMSTTKTPIQIYYDINGTKVQWALGLMLVEANKISTMFKHSGEQLDIYSMESTYKALVGICLAVMIVLTWIVGYHRRKGLSVLEETCLPLFTTTMDDYPPVKRKTSDSTICSTQY